MLKHYFAIVTVALHAGGYKDIVSMEDEVTFIVIFIVVFIG